MQMTRERNREREREREREFGSITDAIVGDSCR